MNNAWKAALLSALVIPGLGQLVLKKYVRGGVMITTVALLITALSLKCIGIVLTILAGIEDSGTTPNTADILVFGWQAVKNSSGPAFSTLFALLAACWLYSSIDAYLLGGRLDRSSRHISRYPRENEDSLEK